MRLDEVSRCGLDFDITDDGMMLMMRHGGRWADAMVAVQ